MIISAHQPAYLPWLGYMKKIMCSDIFVFLDTVQFEKNSFINRNKIKTANGASWLTVPVISKGHFDSTLMELKIDPRSKWQRKHLNSIVLNYKKAENFEEILSKITSIYEQDYELLCELCYDYLKVWLEQININTKIVRLSELGIKSKKSDLVLDICKYFKADQYLSGALGKNYLKQEDFLKAGVAVLYQNYEFKEYPQLWGDSFLPNMSILDFVMNTKEYSLI